MRNVCNTRHKEMFKNALSMHLEDGAYAFAKMQEKTLDDPNH